VALLPQLAALHEFETARRLLRNLHYTEESVCARTGLSSIFQFKTLDQGRTSAADLNDGLDALIRLLLDAEPLSDTRMRYLLPEETVGALETLGLIVRMGGQGSFFSTARLSPVEGLFIASDRVPPLDPELLFDRREMVFDPISWNTGTFLRSLPRQECESVLDLCCGAALEALVCARKARHVWACDLTSRSIHFAEFNRRLNGIGNITFAQGDLYEAVKQQTFDRIVAHPPYVPDVSDEMLVYRDGGDDGEKVLRRIVEGLPAHLRPGGMFYAFVMSTDRESGTLTDRIRQWLGTAAGEFEITLDITGEAEMKWYERVREQLQITRAYFATLTILRK
jgi:methylase of polypeptide subunit release factors